MYSPGVKPLTPVGSLQRSNRHLLAQASESGRSGLAPHPTATAIGRDHDQLSAHIPYDLRVLAQLEPVLASLHLAAPGGS